MIEDRGVEIWEWNQPNLALPVAAPTPSRAVPPAMAARVRSAVASGRRAHPSGFEVVAHPQPSHVRWRRALADFAASRRCHHRPSIFTGLNSSRVFGWRAA
jgi:hypothetical protein